MVKSRVLTDCIGLANCCTDIGVSDHVHLSVCWMHVEVIVFPVRCLAVAILEVLVSHVGAVSVRKAPAVIHVNINKVVTTISIKITWILSHWYPQWPCAEWQFWKIFELERFIRILLTNFIQIFCRIIIYFQVIMKNEIGLDENFQRIHWAFLGLRVCKAHNCLILIHIYTKQIRAELHWED